MNNPSDADLPTYIILEARTIFTSGGDVFLSEVCQLSVREGKDATVGFILLTISRLPQLTLTQPVTPRPCRFRGATNAAANVTSDSYGFSGRLELQNTHTAKEARNG